MSTNTKISEFFNFSTKKTDIAWKAILSTQHCGYLGKKCVKIRKSEPDISIGSCTVEYGKKRDAIIICPHRLTEKRQIFIDCIHLLTLHEPGNEMHVISEVGIPGGSVDYFWCQQVIKKWSILWGLNFKHWTPRERFGQKDNGCWRIWGYWKNPKESMVKKLTE